VSIAAEKSAVAVAFAVASAVVVAFAATAAFAIAVAFALAVAGFRRHPERSEGSRRSTLTPTQPDLSADNLQDAITATIGRA
jgi:hypothetical protein